MKPGDQPAFPQNETINGNTVNAEHGEGGMTMRQYYKAAALQGITSNLNMEERSHFEKGWEAKIAGDYADAFIKEDLEHEKKGESK